MDTFNFPNHKRSYKYINNSDTIELGNGYSFVAKPKSPMLKEFTITITGFRYYFDETGAVDYDTNSDWDNVGTLCKFYEEHGTYDKFVYPDEQFGDVTVRFKEPLEIGNTNGKRAVVDDISFTLAEVTE